MRLCTPRASGWIGILGQCDQGEDASSSAAEGQPGQIVILFWPSELSEADWKHRIEQEGAEAQRRRLVIFETKIPFLGLLIFRLALRLRVLLFNLPFQIDSQDFLFGFLPVDFG